MDKATGLSDVLADWNKEKKSARTPQAKTKFNVWDNFLKDVLPVIKNAVTDKVKTWSWYKNQDCKYIDVRIDMRTGHCIIKNRYGVRINPENLLYQHE